MKDSAFSVPDPLPHHHRFVISLQVPESLSTATISQYLNDHTASGDYKILPEDLTINNATFSLVAEEQSFIVTMAQFQEQLTLFCNCLADGPQLCEHQRKVLAFLLERDDLLLFFNTGRRKERLKKVAFDFGMENEPDLDQHFKLHLEQNQLLITPVQQNLMPVTAHNLKSLVKEIHPGNSPSPQGKLFSYNENIVILKQHKYYSYLQIELYHTERTRTGKIKNPLRQLNPNEYLWRISDPDELKFLLGISKLQNNVHDLSEEDLKALRAVIHNPFRNMFYYHLPEVSDHITVASVYPTEVRVFPGEVRLQISSKDDRYEVSAQVVVENEVIPLSEVELRYDCFLVMNGTFYLVDRLPLIRALKLLKQKSGTLLVHKSGFREFRSQFLDEIEDIIKIEYRYIELATDEQLKTNGFTAMERIIYLSDFGSYVMIIPVIRYGEVEIAIRSQRKVYGHDHRGKEFLVKRNDEEEAQLSTIIVKQHPDFEEQLDNGLHYFYLHKTRFLEEDWFLRSFEDWLKQGIKVLGFDEIEGNKLKPHPAKIDIKVTSGLNWFNAQVGVKYGNTKAPLKKIQDAVRNKSKYVQLDDGTFGILPKEWMEKFVDYFNAGEITADDIFNIPKINFTLVEELFEEKMFDEPVREELTLYRQKFQDFSSIKKVTVPAALNGTLRSYQQEGLNWLNFLDDLNFGGCLADDMGLGKSIQIIAFILHLNQKCANNTNLLIVPTTLMFNWKAELRKFAPTLKVLALEGADRVKNTKNFDQSEVILISYNTLLTDISYLKNYAFNYVFLDESQQIKNPESQRYKAARLLKSRNKIVITGTPVENNTFDLYSQFSFACPGLFGNKRHFKELYSVPVDQFKNSKRVQELQDRIRPFLLRRTKDQVAKELPDKTELVLFCEMQEEQRKVYDAYEKEFREYISAVNDEEIQKHPMNVLRGLTKLRQICNSTKLLDREDLSGWGTSSKLDALMEQIENNAPHHKMLVFSQFVSMLELIKQALKDRNIGFSMLTGSTRNREAVVNEFQKNVDKRVFLISLKAGGTGLNLTEASYVYLVDPWWNPAVENQAIDRAYRIGQHKKVTAIRLICPDTVEEKIMQLQDSKKELSSGLISDDNSIFRSLTKEDLLRLVHYPV